MPYIYVGSCYYPCAVFLSFIKEEYMLIAIVVRIVSYFPVKIGWHYERCSHATNVRCLVSAK